MAETSNTQTTACCPNCARRNRPEPPPELHSATLAVIAPIEELHRPSELLEVGATLIDPSLLTPKTSHDIDLAVILGDGQERDRLATWCAELGALTLRIGTKQPVAPLDASVRFIKAETTQEAERIAVGVIASLGTHGLLCLNFDDIQLVTAGTVGFGVSVPPTANVTREVLDKLHGFDTKTVTGLLAHIRGGVDLSLSTINDVSEKVAARFSEDANMILAASIDEAMEPGLVEVMALMMVGTTADS